MRFALGDVAQQMADQITALGVPTVIDARDLNLPGGWVSANALDYTYLDKSRLTATFDIYLIGRDNGTQQALNDLGDMVAKLTEALHIGDVRVQTVTDPNLGADPLPALQFSIEAELEMSD